MTRATVSAPPSTALIVADAAPSGALAHLEELVASAAGYAADAKSSATRRAYATDFRAFETWCEGHGARSLPATPSTVAVYLAALADAGKRPSTIERALAGIAHAHRTAGHPWEKGNAAIRSVVTGIRRRLGVAQVQKAPTLADELAAMVGKLGSDLGGLRDRALLTLGFLGAFRRSELVALNVADLETTREGLLVHVRRSKTDQAGEGMVKAIPYASDANLCAVRAVRDWLAAAGIAEGAIFRAVSKGGAVGERLEGRAVARLVQRSAEAAGLDGSRYSGHSLRAGFVTVATKRGKDVAAIMRQTGHKNPATVAKYVRLANAFEQSAAVGLV
jgi:site-specific recombinase XerD